MLNEERIRCMIKAAEFEEKDGLDAFKVNGYFREDYVTYHMIKAGISGTCAFVILMALVIFSQLESFLASLSTLDLAAYGMGLLEKYLLFLVVFELIVIIAYNMKYSRMRKRIKEHLENLERIGELYDEEENRTSSRKPAGGSKKA